MTVTIHIDGKVFLKDLPVDDAVEIIWSFTHEHGYGWGLIVQEGDVKHVHLHHPKGVVTC